jgi:hypothetical protein
MQESIKRHLRKGEMAQFTAEDTSAAERLQEIGSLLAGALMRSGSGKSSQMAGGAADKSVDCEGVSSGHHADHEPEKSECPKA